MRWILLILLVTSVLIADDTELFKVSVPPHALVVIDYSGSMCWTPDVDSTANIYPCNRYSLPLCPVDQSKYGIMRTVMFDLLDADDDGDIDLDDEKELNVPMGFLRYSGYGGIGGSLYPRYYYVIRDIGSHYRDIWDAIWTPRPWGGTPMNEALNRANKPAWYYESARWYLTHVAFPSDPARHCRQYAVILLTDGEDTYDCGGSGGYGSPSRRRASVHAAWRLHQLCPDSLQRDSILTYVVGLGANLSSYLKNTLNWMAYYGGTDNPLEPNQGNPNAYPSPDDSCSGSIDPGKKYLRGYAFIAEDAQELAEAIKVIFEQVSKMKFSFSSVGVPSVISEKYSSDSCAFIGSFIPDIGGFWYGHLYKVKLDTSLQAGDTLWDAGLILQNVNPDLRKIYTIKNGIWTPFDSAHITPADLGVSTEAEKMTIINKIRGPVGGWKLGDIFHSSPLYVGAPVPFFYDRGYQEFIQHWMNRPERVYVGANDGLFHAFDAQTGNEEWALIPPNLLPKLKKWTLTDTHSYYVDAPPVAYGIWDDKTGDSIKTWDEWRTWLVCGQRRGGNYYMMMDVTDPSLGSITSQTPIFFTDSLLGQTWSVPVIDRIKYRSGVPYPVERWFVCFGGGYDTTNSNVGRSFYIVDIGGDNNGPNNFGVKCFNPHNTPGLIHCIPASPAVADISDSSRPGKLYPDTYADKIFVADHGADLWLIDIGDYNINNWRMAKIFENYNPDLHCFFAPSLALQVVEQNVGDTVIVFKKIPWLFWGTGDRANPADTIVENRFYAMKYPDTSNVATETDLYDITNGGQPDTSDRGWYIRLEPGEKVVCTPIVFNEVVYFTTFKPDVSQSQDPCTPAVGTSYLYAMEAWTGSKLPHWPGRRRPLAIPGLPPQPKIVATKSTVRLILPGEEIEIEGPPVKFRYEAWESSR